MTTIRNNPAVAEAISVKLKSFSVKKISKKIKGVHNSNLSAVKKAQNTMETLQRLAEQYKRQLGTDAKAISLISAEFVELDRKRALTMKGISKW